MSKTVFNFNTPVTAEWFNNINGQRLRFDGNPNYPNDLVDGQYYPIRTQDLDPSVLAGYSQSLDVVSTTTNQNVDGSKTFINPITIAPGINNNHAITKAQLEAATATLNASIAASNAAITAANNARAALEAATVKLTTDQTIYNTKTFANSPIVPPGSVPGAAVNFAQFSSLLLPYSNTGVIKIGNQQIVYGRTFVNGDWSAGGAVNININFSSHSPTYSQFISIPSLQVSTDRLLAIQTQPNTTGFNLILDQANAIYQPNDAFICWSAFGTI